MKPQLLKHHPACNTSFTMKKEMGLNINSRWHFHAELELIHFHRGSGTQFIGDHISRFSAGDMVLVGANLPHFWKYDEDLSSSAESSEEPYSTVIHFKENLWGDSFLNLPEMDGIRTLLQKAKRGIQLHKDFVQAHVELLRKVSGSTGFQRMMLLMQCLDQMEKEGQYELLSSLAFQYHPDSSETESIQQVYDYVLRNYHRNIYLEEVADAACISAGAFCRFFKSRTSKTFTHFLTEVRIGAACRLLLENRLSIKRICFESGFNNFSCFNKRFKEVTGRTPIVYQKEYSSHS